MDEMFASVGIDVSLLRCLWVAFFLFSYSPFSNLSTLG